MGEHEGCVDRLSGLGRLALHLRLLLDDHAEQDLGEFFVRICRVGGSSASSSGIPDSSHPAVQSAGRGWSKGCHAGLGFNFRLRYPSCHVPLFLYAGDWSADGLQS
jgi:hypothetical protein